MESPQTFDKIIQFLKGNRAMAIQNHGFASTKQHGLKPVDIRFLTMYSNLIGNFRWKIMVLRGHFVMAG